MTWATDDRVDRVNERIDALEKKLYHQGETGTNTDNVVVVTLPQQQPRFFIVLDEEGCELPYDGYTRKDALAHALGRAPYPEEVVAHTSMFLPESIQPRKK